MHVFPLSFSEYYNYHQGKSDTAYQLFLNYVQDGGFPLVSIATDAEVKASIKEGIIDSVILNDVLLRSRLRDETALLRLVGYLMGEVGNSISVSKIVSTLKSNQINVSNPTINTYLDLLKRAFVFYSAKNYDLRGRKYLSANEKYYVVDTGLRNTFINKSGRDSLGHQLEDIVYIELLRRGYQVDVGKYGSKEIDFVARKGDETVYYQVTQQLPENSKRETDNLRYIPDGYKKKVLTLNLLDQGTVDGIEVEYVIDWLLKN
ncbi:ATP-binding protein [Lactobacillus sp. PSON]